MLPYRIGFGYDSHRLVEVRPLILGGINIPHTHGLEGHSDADCLTHAIADAIFGAAGLRDIGHYFPDTDSQWKNMDSQVILRKANEEIGKLGYIVGNIDATIVAEAPKIGPHIDLMREKMAAALAILPTQIGIKATTNEKMGPEGRREGISATAVCLITKKET